MNIHTLISITFNILRIHPIFNVLQWCWVIYEPAVCSSCPTKLVHYLDNQINGQQSSNTDVCPSSWLFLGNPKGISFRHSDTELSYKRRKQTFCTKSSVESQNHQKWEDTCFPWTATIRFTNMVSVLWDTPGNTLINDLVIRVRWEDQNHSPPCRVNMKLA